MTIQDLQPLIEPEVAVDVMTAFESFRSSTGGTDPMAFVEHLHRTGVLGDEAHRRVLAAARLLLEPAALDPTLTSVDDGAQVTVSDAGPARVPGGSRFNHLGVIGEGGMGQIFLAQDQDLLRKVAIKQLRPEMSSRPRIVGRFLTEVQITAQLDHPNVIPVYGLEVDPRGAIRYAMKFIQGKTLKDVIDETVTLHQDRKPIDEAHSLPTRLDIFLKVCDAIDYAHNKGVVHRDLKPPNIMIGRYREVYVMDWGIARVVSAREDKGLEEAVELARADGTDVHLELTQAGQVVGTPRYMSPEQAMGQTKDLDGRSDEYALGLILFELVSLRRAVPGTTAIDTLRNTLQAIKAPLVHLDPHHRIPGELQAVINKATQLDREDRYPTVAAMADDIRRFLRGEAVRARPDNPIQKLLRGMSRHREWTLAILLGVVLLGVLGFVRSEVQRQAQEAESFEHERRVKDLLSAVSKQGHLIDARFLRLEGALEGLATAATLALTRGAPAEERFYTGVDFATPGRQPPDLGSTKVYRWPVSLEWPVSVLRPGLALEEVAGKLQRLASLRRYFRTLFLQSVPEGIQPLSPEREREMLANEGVALDFAYVVLPEGVLHMFPGMGECPPDYDVRGAGFYTLSAHKYGRFWGSPYVDATEDSEGDELILPCTTSLYSDSGEFLGVAGVEMTFNRIIVQLLSLKTIPAVLETTLVDDAGRKIVDSRDLGKRFHAAKTDVGVELSLFEIPEVVSAIKQKRTGTIECSRGGKRELVAFYRLEMKGWYYVVEVDAREFFGR